MLPEIILQRKGSLKKSKRLNQCKQWNMRFQELLEFRKENGHCFIPHNYSKNPSLGRWVKRQRYQYSLMKKGIKSSISKERIKMLDNAGFIWNSREVSWQERLKEVQSFRKKYGHGFIPFSFTPNPQLAIWAKCQRRQYKLYLQGKTAFISAERIEALEEVGFEWDSVSKRMPENMLVSTNEDYDLMLEVLSLLSEKEGDACSRNESKKLIGMHITF